VYHILCESLHFLHFSSINEYDDDDNARLLQRFHISFMQWLQQRCDCDCHSKRVSRIVAVASQLQPLHCTSCCQTWEKFRPNYPQQWHRLHRGVITKIRDVSPVGMTHSYGLLTGSRSSRSIHVTFDDLDWRYLWLPITDPL